ncbi:sugar-binding transcriptional regulator [Corynebacterium sp. TAE3-ERU2]|uniref:sugar-binding transcriptional regulator n=1 Tax=Corynebacterium sp. TAE3-ERU2 TaxID=2849497 RepID=UPI001C48DC03|nr:sugar-binding transcriptional regulator [Corynebacterium sp. TAE3-ERU2]MBV7303119.1 sugar-binding transcriptional regulator [Corynebacterium sp. TAE3-ERU2]
MDARDEQALRAAKLYYESEMSQAEVAAEMGISRPTVAKLLQYARERGYVVIQILDPREERGHVAETLVERFGQYGLKEVRVVHTARESSEEILKELGRMGALVLQEHVDDGHLVGVSWGNTMYAVARALSDTPRQGVEIVQLKGGLSYSERSSNDIETINLFCRAFGAYARTLPLPVIFDNAETKAVVEQDRLISHTLELGAHTDVAIFTVGAVHRDSLPLSMGYLSEREIQQLERDAVGDACSRFFTSEGAIAAPSVDERTVGISLSDLSSRPVRILVAGGLSKTAAIAAALRMGLATHLVIDHQTACAVLER